MGFGFSYVNIYLHCFHEVLFVTIIHTEPEVARHPPSLG